MVAVEKKVINNPGELTTDLRILDPQLTSQEILDLELRGKRWEIISLAQINMSVKIVDQSHVEDLGDSIFGKNNKGALGQISPIITAAFPNFDSNGSINYEITDGFHRTETFIQRGSPTIEAIVLYGISEEEMYDLRILAANSVKSTSFARIAEWMCRSFEQTKWFKEKGLTLLQAFSLCVQDTSGVRLQLEPEETVELKAWVESKASVWGKKIPSIWNDLVIISKADPELVRLVRVGKGGGHGEGKGVINPARLRAIVNNLPVDSGLQRTVAEAVIWGDLDAQKTDLLAQAVAAFQDEPDTVQVICSQPQTVATMLDIIPESPTKHQLAKELILVSGYHDLNPDETVALTQAVVDLDDNDSEAKDRLYEDPRSTIRSQPSLPTLTEIPDPVSPNSLFNKPIEQHGDTEAGGYIKQPSTAELEQQIEALQSALADAARRKGGGLPWLSAKRKWWVTIPDLTLNERRALEYVIRHKKTIKQAARLMNKTPNQLVILIKSGLRKGLLHIQESFEEWYDNTILIE